MNRRQKIIVSVVGIFIVLLALVGITYGYFLTRIQGNTNTTSISVNTAKLELLYGDNSEEIIVGNGLLMPTVETEPDDAIGTKTFTVTNNGNDSSYVVIIDNVNITKASDGTPTTFKYNTFRYKLLCTVKDKDGKTIENEKCNEVASISVLPINGGILVGNSILENRVHEYTLTMWYIDNGEDQTEDMAKTYQARVNIADVTQMQNPFKTGVTATDNASLAYNIIENAKSGKNGTKLLNTPLTNVAEQTSEYVTGYELLGEMPVPISEISAMAQSASVFFSNSANTACTGTSNSSYKDTVGKYMCIINGETEMVFYIKSFDEEADSLLLSGLEPTQESEKTLSVTTDDYGISYYYRGNVEDNYVTFSNKCWRIVRIQGDGSIKLVLESQTPCSESMTSNFSIGEAFWGYRWHDGKYLASYNKNGTVENNGTMRMAEKLTTWLNETNNNGEKINITTKAEALLKTEDWCLGNTTSTYAYSSPYELLGTSVSENYTSGIKFYYETARNLYGYGVTPNATLKCNGETVSSKIGALTADEVVFAGEKAGSSDTNNYLLNGSSNTWWTLSLSDFDGSRDHAFGVYGNGGCHGSYSVNSRNEIRPAVSLNTGVKITGGEGTKGNPYIITE